MIFKFLFIFLIFCLKQSTQFEINIDTLNKINDLLEGNGFSVNALLNDIKSSFNQEQIFESAFLKEKIKDNIKDLTHREPDSKFTPKQMIEFRGFKYEEHEVITEDCYILTMHRIVKAFGFYLIFYKLNYIN